MTAPGSAADDRRVIAAIDVGGTSMKAALIDRGYRVVREWRTPTPRDAGPDAVIRAIGAQLADLIAAAPDRPSAAGVVVPGIVDEARGVAVISVNLGWQDVSLAQVLADASGLPVALGHDVRAGALAEHRIGAGRGAAGMLFLPIGFGIAGAIIADGRPLVSDGYAGEIGHLVVDPDGVTCGCGARGCLETVASASAIGRRYAARAGRATATAAEVADLVATGETLAREIWAEAVTALAIAISATTTVVGSELVVIGGGLALAGDRLLAPLRDAVRERLTFQRVPRIVGAALGDRAGCLGAAILANERADRT